MARALSPDREQPYVLAEDKKLPVAEQTVWFIRPLTYDQYVAAQDQMVEMRTGKKRRDSVTRVLSGTNEQQTLLAGLVRVDNFRDEDGKLLAFPVDGGHTQKMTFLSRLKPAWRTELAKAILGDTELDEDEAGESASASGARSPGADASRPLAPTAARSATAD